MNIQRTLRRVAAFALLLGVAGTTTACDFEDLLDVTDRDRVTPATLEDPDVINVVIAGAMGDFQGAYSGQGNEDRYISSSATLTDEFYSAGTFTTRTATDRRSQFAIPNGNLSDSTYTNLHYARRALKDAVATVGEHPDFGTSSAAYAELKALEAYTLVALGEGFCSSIPLSNVGEGGEFVFGQPMTSAEILQEAVTRFDASLGATSNGLAAVGKARALLMLGQYDAAASAVADIPMDWVYHIQQSESGGSNSIFDLQGNGRYGLGDGRGGGIPFVGIGAEYDNPSGGPVLEVAGDGRTPWWGPVPGFDETIPQYHSFLYNGVGDDVPLASGVEAWLIRAEAAMQGGDLDGMTTMLNELRANTVMLMDALHEWPVADGNVPPPLDVPGSEAEAVDVLFQERALWLLLTGHRLGDLRRLIYQYGIDAYPSGEYFKGGVYGDDVVLPVQFDETNNPNFTLDGCDVESASIN